MARKRKHYDYPNIDRWMVSYADFVTLLFAFFVVMYAISSVNEGKYRVLSESLIASFRSPTKSLHPVQVGKVVKSPLSEQMNLRKTPVVVELPDMPMPRYEAVEEPGYTGRRSGRGGRRQSASPKGEFGGGPAGALKEISEEIEQAMAAMIEQGLIGVRRSERWVEVEINNSVLFASGSARISRQALPVLKRLARILRRFPNAIHVEGFTDNVPINNVIFPSNWELSAGRAASVVHLFTKEGVEPQRLVAIGYGQYQPVADNSTAEGRRRNRRVVLVVQSTADTREAAAAALGDGGDAAVLMEQSLLENGGETVATPAERSGSRPHRPSRSGILREPGRFPVVAPPIQLPFGQSGDLSFDGGQRRHGP